MAKGTRWTEDETKLALYLYFQLPFGKFHSSNPEVIALAKRLDRTPSSIAMKLCNFASLDPEIVKSGRKGLQGASALDRHVWQLFHNDWTKLVAEVGLRGEEQQPTASRVHDPAIPFCYEGADRPTTARAEIERRIGQNFFRRAVLANFGNICCVTGIAESRLLVASHISSWKTDVVNRHNPRNGLCLSATFDAAFDRYLMTVTPELQVRFSKDLLASESQETRDYFEPYEGAVLRTPTNLAPDPELLRAHNARFSA